MLGVSALEGGESDGRVGWRSRPQTGCVERLQLSSLEEGWRPALERSLAGCSTALERDRDEHVDYFNFDRTTPGP